ncbi:efflux RND transporter periplasmic adaptor subunit [Spirosoma sordidisoli]|uniref:Efflux RND transporter periplasmic adaptor subunit n=1 Tax=Spirosoma sordidisoli TaxID=2502893 RepID=A0A4Q2UI88_9BACT|nr:efflux RND transporter periplasmic adaptor subunit [Spirosoma sordidisoli]RYC68272.1 efflux RND transporter periplasmic adaptor subunit [Spirosoma sordidisoli]
MKAYYAIALTTSLLMACGGEKKNDLEGKRAELSELKAKQAELNTQIKTLEGEVAKLDPKKKEEARVKDVVVSPITASTFRRYVELQGTIDAKNNVQVSPKSGGAVTAVYVVEGSSVRAGQLLARLDDQILRTSLEEIKTQLSLANTVFEKQANLWKQQIGTEIQYLQAKNNKESLERRLATLNSQLSQSNVTAPISGVVDKVLAKVGSSAAPGVPMFQIVNLSQLKVKANVADTYAGSVKKGDEVIVRFPDVNRELKTRVNFVSTTVDPLSRTFTIEAPLPSDRSLKPNMLAQIKINDVNKSNALVINQNLIQNTESGQLVYVAVNEGGKKVAKSRKITPGQSYGGQIEIIAGLKPGDQLVTQGYQELTDGTPINY